VNTAFLNHCHFMSLCILWMSSPPMQTQHLAWAPYLYRRYHCHSMSGWADMPGYRLHWPFRTQIGILSLPQSQHSQHVWMRWLMEVQEAWYSCPRALEWKRSRIFLSTFSSYPQRHTMPRVYVDDSISNLRILWMVSHHFIILVIILNTWMIDAKFALT
jgi:hypothetical protein